MANIFKILFNNKQEDAPDKLGLYPEKNHVAALPERRYLFTSHYLVIIAVVNLCINIMLTCVLFYLLPQKRMDPRFMAIDYRFNTVSLVEKSERTVDSVILATQTYLAEYIYLRHSASNNINLNNRQWGENSKVFWYSDQPVYKKFQHDYIPKELAYIQEHNVTRDVEILTVTRRYQGVWRAEFITHDTSPEFDGIKSTLWRALIRVGFAARHYPSRDEHIKNPLDFVITNYSLTSLGNPED